MGLPIEVYRRTGSTLATAGIVLATLIPSVVLGSVAGVYVDRWDRRRLMVAVNLLLAITVLPLLAVDFAGIWVAYAVLAAASCLEQLFQPAEVALLPSLLEGGEAELVPANALRNTNRQLARFVGPAIGGVTIAVGGLAAVTVDSISFLLAAGLILAIMSSETRAAAARLSGAMTRPRQPRHPRPPPHPGRTSSASGAPAWRPCSAIRSCGRSWRSPLSRSLARA